MNAFAGTGTLTALALRRDRFLLPAWILTVVTVTGFSGAAVETLYRSPEELRATGLGWNASAALVAMHGRIYDLESIGAVALVKLTGLGTAMVALLAVLLVVRHTRADEEIGRTELAAAGVVGRYAALAAALLVTGATVVLIGIGSGLSLLLADLPVGGALAFAISWGGVGLVFTGVGAVAAQLSTGARAARGLGAGAIAAAYAVRAIGDTAPEDGARWFSWLSPIGWAQQVRPYAGDRLWVGLLSLAGTAALVLVAGALLRRRDLGAGLIADRPGPAQAAPSLATTASLVWRLDRLALAGWAAALMLFGAVVGSITTTIGAMLDNPDFTDLITALGGVSVLEDAYLSTALGIFALAVSAYGVSATLRMRHEEAQGRAEQVLAAPEGRTRWALAHLRPALLGTAALMTLAGAAVAAGYAWTVRDAGAVWPVLAAAWVRLPAVWVFVGVVMLLYGAASRWAPLAWVVLTGLVVITELGPVMDLPAWTMRLTPFHYVGSLPGGGADTGGTVGLVLVTLALTAAGLVLFRRRDLQPD